MIFTSYLESLNGKSQKRDIDFKDSDNVLVF